MSSLRIEQAHAILWERMAAGPVVELPLQDALGKVLARPLSTDMDFPPFDRVAMDGFAVRGADTSGATADSPVTLDVVGLAAAGQPFDGSVGAGQATRDMTGAALPTGADAVIKVEDTDGYSDQQAVLYAPVVSGQNVARRAQDLHRGDVVLEPGVCLGSRHVQLIASSGHVQVPVIEPPTAGVCSTGDELVPPDRIPGPGQIRESNNPCVIAVLAESSIVCESMGALVDRREDLLEGLAAGLERFEILVISGGVSKGEKDLVKGVLRELGVELHFENLHLRPGHPATFGTHRSGAVFALPGNPVAVFVSLNTVFSAGLRRRLGYPTPTPPKAWGQLAFSYRRKGNRPMYLPVELKGSDEASLPRLLPTTHHGSGDFASLARADALAWLPDDRADFGIGETVEIRRLKPASSA